MGSLQWLEREMIKWRLPPGKRDGHEMIRFINILTRKAEVKKSLPDKVASGIGGCFTR